MTHRWLLYVIRLVFVGLAGCAATLAQSPATPADHRTGEQSATPAPPDDSAQAAPIPAGMCKGADVLVQCLKAKKAKLYLNCYMPESAELVRALGPTVKDLDIVMCMTCMDVYMTNEECIANKIDDYPTWIFPDGQRLEGRLHIPTLAAKAGCEY